MTKRGYGQPRQDYEPPTDKQMYCFCDVPLKDDERCVKCGKLVREEE